MQFKTLCTMFIKNLRLWGFFLLIIGGSCQGSYNLWPEHKTVLMQRLWGSAVDIPLLSSTLNSLYNNEIILDEPRVFLAHQMQTWWDNIVWEGRSGMLNALDYHGSSTTFRTFIHQLSRAGHRKIITGTAELRRLTLHAPAGPSRSVERMSNAHSNETLEHAWNALTNITIKYKIMESLGNPGHSIDFADFIRATQRIDLKKLGAYIKTLRNKSCDSSVPQGQQSSEISLEWWLVHSDPDSQ